MLLLVIRRDDFLVTNAHEEFEKFAFFQLSGKTTEEMTIIQLNYWNTMTIALKNVIQVTFMSEEPNNKAGMAQNWPDLMLRAQGGDAQAYKRLLREVTPFLRNFLMRRLFNKENVEDIVQEVLMAVHAVRHTYRPEQPFERWLYGIARHKVLDAMRRHYRRDVNEILDETGETFSFLVANKGDEGVVQDIHKALAQLPERQRKVITMAKIEGHSLAEVAKAMDMSEAAVKVTVHRAYKTMKLWLVNNGYE